MKKIIKLSLLLIIGTIALYACSKTEDASSETALQSRVEQEWTFKTESDWAGVYDMTCGEFRSKFPRSTFLSADKIKVTSFEILEIKATDDKRGTATIKYTVSQAGHDFDFTTHEEWLFENDQWCLNLLPAFEGIPMSK